MADKYAYVQQFAPEDVRFLEQLPFTLSLPNQNAIVVHAGLVPGVPLSEQRPIDMYKMRFLVKRPAQEDTTSSVSSSSSQWTALETKKNLELVDNESIHLWATQWDGPEHIYFGHDAVPGLQVSALVLMICRLSCHAAVHNGDLTSSTCMANDVRQQFAFATGLDTGCCYGRELTACVLPVRRVCMKDTVSFISPC